MTANASSIAAPVVGSASASGSLTALEARQPVPPPEDLRRRITYLMLFRVGLISLVMGSTALLYWLSDVDLTSTASLMIFGIIGFTYLLTIIYALRLRRGDRLPTLAKVQLGADLIIASLLVHVTGGAQSAYSFFFPLAIIGAASVGYRRSARAVALAAGSLFVGVAVLGWLQILPSVPGQRLTPWELTSLELVRSLGLNLAGIIAVAFLSVNLGGQLERASGLLATQQTKAADLQVLHEDIIRCLSSGLLTVDLEGRVLTANEAGTEILGDAATIGSKLADTLPVLNDVVDGLEPGESLYRTEIEIPRQGDSPRVLGISISPLSSSTHRELGRVISFQELTQMRDLERSMARAERLAVIGSLAAGVAHEIRNPLASISGSIELLRSSIDSPDDEGVALMGIVTREIDRLNALVGELLDYTNPRPLDVVPLDIAALVRDTLQVFQQDRDFASVETTLKSESTERVTLQGDPQKLRQVLWNLYRNAAEAAKDGGGHVSVEMTSEEDEVRVSVTDDGPGIPPENVDQIFDPFFTTKDRGSGLGLALVHELVTRHNGRIRVFSRISEGTTFEVDLPRKQPQKESE